MLQELANTKIPSPHATAPVLAFVALPKTPPLRQPLPVLLLIHEFWGLAPEICSKAEALAEELECLVIAPDTYRGQSTRFIPKAIFLALTTPQERVNEDLDQVLSWASTLPQADMQNVGLVGFCYGGGKAIRYGIHYRKAKAIAVIYGKPVLDVESLKKIEGSVLGIFGDRDSQFPLTEINGFQEALLKAGVQSNVIIYKGQGHAFWRDMDQVRRGDQPQKQAWIDLTSFLRSALCV